MARAAADGVVGIAAIGVIVVRASRNRVVILLAEDRIIARIAADGVFAQVAIERVIARVAIHRIVARLAVDQIVLRAARERVVPAAAHNRVVVGVAIDQVAAIAAGQQIGAVATIDRVGTALATIDRVVAIVAVGPVVAGAKVDDVVIAATEDGIVTFEAVESDRVGGGTGIDGIVAGAAENRGHSGGIIGNERVVTETSVEGGIGLSRRAHNGSPVVARTQLNVHVFNSAVSNRSCAGDIESCRGQRCGLAADAACIIQVEPITGRGERDSGIISVYGQRAVNVVEDATPERHYAADLDCIATGAAVDNGIVDDGGRALDINDVAGGIGADEDNVAVEAAVGVVLDRPVIGWAGEPSDLRIGNNDVAVCGGAAEVADGQVNAAGAGTDIHIAVDAIEIAGGSWGVGRDSDLVVAATVIDRGVVGETAEVNDIVAALRPQLQVAVRAVNLKCVGGQIRAINNNEFDGATGGGVVDGDVVRGTGETGDGGDVDDGVGIAIGVAGVAESQPVVSAGTKVNAWGGGNAVEVARGGWGVAGEVDGVIAVASVDGSSAGEAADVDGVAANIRIQGQGPVGTIDLERIGSGIRTFNGDGAKSTRRGSVIDGYVIGRAGETGDGCNVDDGVGVPAGIGLIADVQHVGASLGVNGEGGQDAVEIAAICRGIVRHVDGVVAGAGVYCHWSAGGCGLDVNNIGRRIRVENEAFQAAEANKAGASAIKRCGSQGVGCTTGIDIIIDVESVAASVSNEADSAEDAVEASDVADVEGLDTRAAVNSCCGEGALDVYGIAAVACIDSDGGSEGCVGGLQVDYIATSDGAGVDRQGGGRIHECHDLAQRGVDR